MKKKKVHRSPVPLYVTALAWVLYALLLPLYRPVHFAAAVLLTAAVGAAARLLCPDRIEEAEPEPETTGNAQLDEMAAECAAAMEKLQTLDDRIADPVISGHIVRLRQLTGKIMDAVREDPSRLPQIRKFMSYYLPTTIKLLDSYDRMAAQGVEGENITATMTKVENVMATIESAFSKQLDNLFGAEAMDISTDITVLENMMAREGLTESELTAASGGVEAMLKQEAAGAMPE